MKIPAQDHDILKSFLKDIIQLLQDVEPYSQALAANPDRIDIEKRVVDTSYRLFHTIKGTGGFLALPNLIYMAEAFEYSLGLVRTGTFSLDQQHTALIADTCAYLRQKLNTIWIDKSDEVLAEDMRALADESSRLTALARAQAHGFAAEAQMQNYPEMGEAFHGEVKELLEFAEQEFVLWDYIALDQERIRELTLILDRLKRNFALFGWIDLERISQVMEATLTCFLDGDLFQGEYPERVFLRALDSIGETLAGFPLSGDASVADVEQHVAALHGLVRKPIGELLVQAGLVGPDAIENALARQKLENARPKRLGELLVEMGEISEDDISRALDTQTRRSLHASEVESRFASRVVQPRLESGEMCMPDTIRVERKTMEQICALVEELARENGNLQADTGPLGQLLELCRPFGKATVSSLIPRLKRVVHDLAVQSGKKIHFIVQGADCELDHTIVEVLYEPLLHLLRNGIIHGIETASERSEAGKKQGGRLSLILLKKKDEVWISVEDDGRGLAVDEIIKVAVERGIVTEQQAKTLTSSDIAKLIFEIGVQRAPEIVDSSGRGVGMDAVKNSLERLNGRADVLSRPGKGTRINLRVPL